MNDTIIPTTYRLKISSKNQVTLPVALLKQMGWEPGQVFNVIKKDNTLSIKTDQEILAEIHQITAKYKIPGISVEEAIEYAHKHYTDQRYNHED